MRKTKLLSSISGASTDGLVSKTTDVRASARGVLVSIGKWEPIDSSDGSSHCAVIRLSLEDWRAAAVTAPLSRSVADYVKKVEASGRAEALAAARRRLAESIQDVERKKNLRDLRLSAGFSQAQLAEAIGTSQPRIARLEAGKEEPSLTTLRRLANVLNVDMNTINDAF
ncbi:helix-turn-helix transcriptional regulator [Azospirillum argentinense]